MVLIDTFVDVLGFILHLWCRIRQKWLFNYLSYHLKLVFCRRELHNPFSYTFLQDDVPLYLLAKKLYAPISRVQVVNWLFYQTQLLEHNFYRRLIVIAYIMPFLSLDMAWVILIPMKMQWMAVLMVFAMSVFFAWMVVKIVVD